ncbi:MAG: RDD family protein [Acidobacteriota bacterium]|nr:RDD family protein [Acidobacteriota bacterium]
MNPNDRLTIDTPEQIPLELPVAGIGSRALACAIDSLLQIIAIILLLLLFFASMWLFKFNVGSGIGAILGAVVLLFPFLLQWGYFVLFEIFWNGQTPGKRIVGIRVIKESGRPITPMESMGRNLLRAIDMLPGIYAVGVVCMMLNQRSKRLGDYVAGTLLVYDKAIDHARVSWNPNNTGDGPAQTVASGARISPDELALIESYLNRRTTFAIAVRRETARKIAAAITERTGVEPEEGQSTDAFLEALARKARDSAGYR